MTDVNSRQTRRRPPTRATVPGTRDDAPGAAANVSGGIADAHRWFQLGNPLTGLVPGDTTAKDAAVFQRSIRTVDAIRDVTDELVTQTLNLPTGLGNRMQDKHNATMSCGGKEHKRWLCRSDVVAELVVHDLRERVVPMRGNADPSAVLMVQEARPIIVDAIAQQMSTRFRRPVSTPFVTQQADASVSNAEGGNCDDGEGPQHWRCEYGTYHAQIDEAKRRGLSKRRSVHSLNVRPYEFDQTSGSEVGADVRANVLWKLLALSRVRGPDTRVARC
jgi:hypothetical protein